MITVKGPTTYIMTSLEHQATVLLVEDLKQGDETWTSFNLARDEHGIQVEPLSQTAVKWCAIGKTIKIHHELTGQSADADRIPVALGYDNAAYAEKGKAFYEINDQDGRPAVIEFLEDILSRTTIID